MEYAIKKNGMYYSEEFNKPIIQTWSDHQITLQTTIEQEEYSDQLKINKGNHVTRSRYPSEVTCRLTSKYPFSYMYNGLTPKYFNKTKIEDYLYEISYGNIDYEYAYKFFKPTSLFGCSSVRNKNYFGRNFDWLYNNEVQFVVHTPTSLDHFSVIGISGIIPGVEQSNVDDDSIIIEGVDMFKLVPFYLLDGINEKHLFCTHNVVPLDNTIDPTTEIHAEVQEKFRICIPMLVRFILDNFASAKAAIDYIKKYVTIYFSDEMITAKSQSHFLIGDSNDTYVMEFINGEIIVRKWNYITNFQITNVQFGKDNMIQYPPSAYGVNKYGSGLERWDEIVKNYKSANSLSGMKDLMEIIKYSNGYGDPFKCSELTGQIDDIGNMITVDTDPQLCSDAITSTRYKYLTRDRDNPNVWITCHSSIYDIKSLVLYVHNQEGENEYIFEL